MYLCSGIPLPETVQRFKSQTAASSGAIPGSAAVRGRIQLVMLLSNSLDISKVDSHPLSPRSIGLVGIPDKTLVVFLSWTWWKMFGLKTMCNHLLSE